MIVRVRVRVSESQMREKERERERERDRPRHCTQESDCECDGPTRKARRTLPKQCRAGMIVYYQKRMMFQGSELSSLKQ